MAARIEEMIGARVIVFDGALGTELFKRGLPQGISPEEWNLINPAAVAAVHRDYLEAGAQAITTNTFGGSVMKLAEFGLADKVTEINRRGVELAREAAGDRAWVAASMGPGGKLLAPLGETTFNAVYNSYVPQVRAFAAGGADLVIIETMSDISELKAAAMAVRDHSDLPFIATMTFDAKGRTATGSNPAAMAAMLEPFTPLAIGANCGMGPITMAEII
ncbi:homocysteine S-methyltransferase family protein, partial [bacterium]|nr:homocysteine S-methyltransferase family protein [candidate division CSSED10-310 bacterium]